MAQIPHGPSHLYCPFWRKKMSSVCHTCPLWVQIRGKHPQTGVEVDEWNCANALTPLLLIENAKEVRQGAAATESMRNEVTKRSDQTNVALIAIAREASSRREAMPADDRRCLPLIEGL